LLILAYPWRIEAFLLRELRGTFKMAKNTRAVYGVGLVIALWGIFFAFLPWDMFLGSQGAGCPYLPAAATWHRLLSSPLSYLGLSWIKGSARGASASVASDGASRRIDSATNLPIFTRLELARYDGSDESMPILLAIGGEVFDVTAKGKQYYGKDAPYNIFAGKDSSRSLSLGSFDDRDVYNGDTSDFDEQQLKQLKEQIEFYREKYGPAVGVIDKDSPYPTPPPKSKEEIEREAREEAERAEAAAKDLERQQREGIRTTFVVATPTADPPP
jgi:predicted heme/steroid binding protein